MATEQTAAWWVAVTDNGKFAYTTNTGSGSISTYKVDRDGSILLLASVGADTGAGSAPTDLALSEHSRNLFVLNSGTAPWVPIGFAATAAWSQPTSLAACPQPALV